MLSPEPVLMTSAVVEEPAPFSRGASRPSQDENLQAYMFSTMNAIMAVAVTARKLRVKSPR